MEEDGWSIEIDGYQLPESTNKLFDSDWLKATLLINKSGQIFYKPLASFLIEELEQLQCWLSHVAIGNEVSELRFIDPELSFQRIVQNNIPIIRLVYDEIDEENITIELSTDNIELKKYDEMLVDLLNRFPCRCGREHAQLSTYTVF